MTAFEEIRGLPSRSVTDVLRGKAVRRTAEAIAEELGQPIHVLFPNRYRSTNADNSPKHGASHRLNAAGR